MNSDPVKEPANVQANDLVDGSTSAADNMANVRADPVVASVSPEAASVKPVAREIQVAFQLVGLQWDKAFFKMPNVRRLKASAMNQAGAQVAVRGEVGQVAVDQTAEMLDEEIQAEAASRENSHRADRPKEAHEVRVEGLSEEAADRHSTNVREIAMQVAAETPWAAKAVANAEAETSVAIAQAVVVSAAVVRVMDAQVAVGQEEAVDLEDDPAAVDGLVDVLVVAMAVVLVEIDQAEANSSIPLRN